MPTAIDNRQPVLALHREIQTYSVFPTYTDGSVQEMSSPSDGSFIGRIHTYGFSFASAGSTADGGVRSISQNSALYAVLGTTYGGDGQSTFNIPDLSGRLSTSSSSNLPTGYIYGTESRTLTLANVPVAAGGQGAPVTNDQPTLSLHYAIRANGEGSFNGFTGEIVEYATAQIERTGAGFIPADGRNLNIADFQALFARIGTTYGGDGTTTFAVPDLRGKVLVGASSAHPLGSIFGTDATTLSTANLPVSSSGSGVAFDEHQPSIAVNFWIALNGVYPTRDGDQGDPEDPILGEIRMGLGNNNPSPNGSGWALAQGQTLSISQNSALYSLLGTYYGGNGTTNFKLPDMQNNAVVGAGQTSETGLNTAHVYQIGEMGGAETQVLDASETPNLPPSVTANQSFNAPENQTAAGTVAGTDRDVNDTRTYTLSGSGADNALFDITSAGVLTFKAAPDYEGAHAHDYHVTVVATDSRGLSSAPTPVTVNVTDVVENANPVANTDTVTVPVDAATVINVLANDTDPDAGQTLTVTAVTQPASGSAALSDGVVTFTPAAGYRGATSFTYTVSDGNGGAATGTVNVTVAPAHLYTFTTTGTYASAIPLNATSVNDVTTLQTTGAGVTETITGALTETDGAGELAAQPVVIDGPGRIVLTNTANNWTGVTTINAGSTLQGASNTISGSNVVDSGALVLAQSASGTFAKGISGSGSLSVSGLGAGNTLTLSGALAQTGGFSVTDASSVTLAQGGSYTAGLGVVLNGGAFTNLGSVDTRAGGSGSVSLYDGLRVGVGGTITNGSATVTGASIQSAGSGIVVRSTTPTTVNNYGLVSSANYAGAGQFGTAGALTVNNLNGAANGTGGVIYGAGAINFGWGVYNATSGALTVTNQSAAKIVGATYGVYATGASTSVTNSGLIAAGSYNSATGAVTVGGADGVRLDAGGSVTNLAGGTITSASDAVLATGVATIVNAGAITATANSGVTGFSGGVLTVTNAVGGTITGGSSGAYGYGVQQSSGSATVNNYGAMTGSQGGILAVVSGAVTANLYAGSTTGNVVLSGGNDTISLYTGTGTANAGVVASGIILQAAGTLAPASFSLLSFSSGNDTLNLRGAGDGSSANGAAGAISLTSLSSLETINKLDAGTWRFTTASSTNAALNLNAGVVQADAANAFGAGAITFIGVATARYSASGSYANAITINSGVTGSLLIDPGVAVVQNGAIAGPGALTKTGAGALTLSAANTFSGGVSVAAGRLIQSNRTDALGAGGVMVGAGATLELNYTINDLRVQSTTLSGGGTVEKTGGARLLLGGQGVVTVALGSGALIDVQAGTLNGSDSGQAIWTNNRADLNIAAGALFDGVEGAIRVDALTGAGTLQGGFPNTSGSITIGVDDGSGTFSGLIRNGTLGGGAPLVLVKQGVGAQTISGANTFTGGTTISAGVIEAQKATALGTGAVVDNAALNFRTTAGTVANAISGTGSLSVGAVPSGQTLTFSGALTQTGGFSVVDASAVNISGARSGGLNGATLSGAGSTLGVAASGVVVGSTYGVNASAAATVSNAGRIASGSYNSGTDVITPGGTAGVLFAAGGTLNNLSGGSVRGRVGVSLTGGSAAIVNDGAISSSAGRAIDQTSTGVLSVTNRASGTIAGTGGRAITATGVATIDNAGSITSPSGFNTVVLNSTGANSLTNSGAIGGGLSGVVTYGGTIRNTSTGVITVAAAGNGVSIQGAVALTNDAGGRITAGGSDATGSYAAVIVASGVAGAVSVTNAGSLTAATDGFGVAAVSFATVTNLAGGTISTPSGNAIYGTAGLALVNAGSITSGTTGAAYSGVFMTGGTAATNTLLNSGAITGGYSGVYLTTGAVTNTASGTITGSTNAGVIAGSGAVSIDNFGAITGATGGIAAQAGATVTASLYAGSTTGAISLADGNDVVSLYTGVGTSGAGAVGISAAEASATIQATSASGDAVLFERGLSLSTRDADGEGEVGAARAEAPSSRAAGDAMGPTSIGEAINAALAAGPLAAASFGSIALGGGTNTLNLRGAGDGTAANGTVGVLNLNAVTGATTLAKLDAGTWAFSTASSAAQAITFSAGVLEARVSGALGTGAITFGVGVQTLQLDGQAAGGSLANVLAGLGAGDRLDVRGVTGAALARAVGTDLVVTNTAGATLYTFHLDAPTAAGTNYYATAADGVGGTLLTVGINDNAPVFASTATSVSVVENGTGVLTASATDADAGNTVTYAITGGADAARFTVDRFSGAVTFKVAPDREAATDAGGDNVYDLVITASDGLSSHDVTRTLAVTVTDVNDSAPVLNAVTNPGAVVEAADASAQAISAAVSLSVSDADTTGTLSASAAAGTAKLNGATPAAGTVPAGLLAASALSFGTAASNGGAATLAGTYAPGAANLDFLRAGDVLTITFAVAVSDGVATSTSRDVTVTITGTNDAPTGVAVVSGGLSIAENSANGVQLATLAGIDADDATFLALRDSAGGRFALDGDGRLTVADGTRLDYETATSHAVVVRITDASGAFVDRTLTVQVTDVADEAVVGTPGADTLNGGAGADVISGLQGPDVIFGGAGNDVLYGNQDADVLNGGADNDVLYGGQGDDQLFGADGNDLLQGGLGDDVLSGDGGIDTASYFGATAGVTVSLLLQGQAQATGVLGNDTLSGIENLVGSDFADVLTGDAGDNALSGGEGADLLTGGLGRDTLVGGGGDDVLYGNQDIDVLSGGDGADVLYGGQGDDALDGGAGADVLQGGGGADTLTGGAGADVFRYVLAADSAPGLSDLIGDFASGEDKLDLRSLHTGGASDSFVIASSGGQTTVDVFLAGHTTADLHITLTGTNALTSADVLWG